MNLNPKRIASILIGFLTLLLGGCSTTNEVHVAADSNLKGYKTAYLVVHGGNSSDMDGHIEDALVDRGVRVRSGTEEGKPADVDFYVTYDDTWRWDITMYLKDLRIAFTDRRSGERLASGYYSNSLVHSFPNPGATVSGVIATMYGEPLPK